ncbi:amidase [Meridianimarinicoccus roseus]|uniref:Amidase n=1 Tax=Meridianimarinicoccus roseus TaxID=2072018 RepID=A0A2V2LT57_9RHOB|nr:amidase [Meridianimarinicoccus roseus]PWR04603.1 amidase [Meridianimarinicoccus roseus]
MRDTADAFIEMFTLPGAPGGPLAGLTFGAKDLYDVAGRVTGCGNPEWARTHPEPDAHAPAVADLLAAGATLLGKTHTDELAYSLMGVNAHYGTPINTADPRRVPGGSSSGSAAAVAAGLVDIGLGSDTGGSVRLPASFCGLWGLRTTFGALSLDGAMPFTRSFDTVGWFTRDGETMARVAEACGCPAAPPPAGLVMPVDLWARADAATVEAAARSLAALQDLAGPIRPVVLAPGGLEDWRETFRICQAAEIWQTHGDWITAHAPAFGPGVRERFAIAASIDADTFAAADRRKADLRARISEVLLPDVVFVLPTGPGPAPLRTADAASLDVFRTRAFDMLCPAGLGGLPQLSVPSGRVDGGPVGISLVGPPGRDRALIALACAAGLGSIS